MHGFTESKPLELTVTHRGQAHQLSFLPTDALALLHARLEELTSVPPSHQKLLYKGKSPRASDDSSIADAGLRDGSKVQMLGPTAEELGGLRAAENEHQRRERIMRERAMKAPVKVRSTSSPTSSAAAVEDAQYRFHRLEPLPHLPEPQAALALLTRISEDMAIRHVMRKHKLSVPLLTELAPHEHPDKLGVNISPMHIIKLRLRTDAYDGFRSYNELRRVLCHELAHNVHQNHDTGFKELNSQLNREVAEYERAAVEGTHRLDAIYSPHSELEAEARTYLLSKGPQVLGGSAAFSVDDSPEHRRHKALDAAMRRLRKEEEELEHHCGTAGPSSTV